jgi:hypothetical protein
MVRVAAPDRQLAFVYLANDLLQNSRKSGPEFINEFARYISTTFPLIFQYVGSCCGQSDLTLLVGTATQQRRNLFCVF